jgi:hypothetical protein
MEMFFAFIITKQFEILCVMIPSKHFCIFRKNGKELKGEDVIHLVVECAFSYIFDVLSRVYWARSRCTGKSNQNLANGQILAML